MLVKTDKVHLIGIGGYGMSALAKLLLEMGYSVSGSDLAPSDITRHLEEMGAEISIGHHARNVQDRDVVIYSTAIPEENDELRAGKEAGKVLHRSELLAEFLNSNTGIAVTGAHGKTTTTTMLALIMERGGLDPTALIGGEVQDFSGTARLGKSNYVVAEADESDQSFSRYRPTYAMITNIEADHLEHYNGSFDQLLDGYGNFVANIKPEGLLIIPKEDKWIGEILPRVRCRKITFGIGSGDYRAEKVVLNALGSRYNLFREQEDLGEVSLNVPGKHNIYNAVAAAAMALELGVNFTALGGALAAFQGAKRRFQILAWQPFMVVETEKGWEIRNAVLWDLNGRTVKMFPKETFSDSAVTACCVTWISEDLLAFNTQYMVFIYCISADTLTLADDMRLIQAEMDRSMLPYMGMSEEPDGAFGGKYYYFPHKNPQFSNVKGAVWEAGEDGSRALFGGLEFNRFAMSGNLMAMTVEKDDRASLYYAFTNDPEPRYIGEISSSYSLQVNGSRVSWLEETADSQSFGCFDTDTKTAGAVSFDQWRQLVFYGTRPSGGSLEFLFTEWKDGSDNLYSCDLLTDTRTLLYEDIHIYTNSQPSPDMTKFYTYTGTGDSDSAIRVISIE